MKTNEGDTRRNEKITLSSDNKMTVRELTEIRLSLSHSG